MYIKITHTKFCVCEKMELKNLIFHNLILISVSTYKNIKKIGFCKFCRFDKIYKIDKIILKYRFLFFIFPNRQNHIENPIHKYKNIFKILFILR